MAERSTSDFIVASACIKSPAGLDAARLTGKTVITECGGSLLISLTTVCSSPSKESSSIDKEIAGLKAKLRATLAAQQKRQEQLCALLRTGEPILKAGLAAGVRSAAELPHKYVIDTFASEWQPLFAPHKTFPDVDKLVHALEKLSSTLPLIAKIRAEAARVHLADDGVNDAITAVRTGATTVIKSVPDFAGAEDVQEAMATSGDFTPKCIDDVPQWIKAYSLARELMR